MKTQVSKKVLYLLAMLALPRVYMLDWTNTPSELLSNYITSSNDFVMPEGDGHIVFIAELAGDGHGQDEDH